MSLPNNFCGGRRARTIQRYCCHAHLALGDTSFWMGELLPAREHLEMAITLYDPERHWRSPFAMAGLIPGYFACHTWP